jgi:hypothetical protein
MVYKIVSASTSKVIDIMKPKSILRKFAPGSVNFGRKRTAEKKCTFQKEHSEQIYDVSDPQDQFWHTDQPKIDSRTGKPVQIHNPEIVEFENRSWIDEGYQFPEVKREMHRDTYNYRFDKRHEGLQTLQKRIENFARRVVPKISSNRRDFCIEYEKFCEERSLDTESRSPEL